MRLKKINTKTKKKSVAKALVKKNYSYSKEVLEKLFYRLSVGIPVTGGSKGKLNSHLKQTHPKSSVYAF